MHKEVLQIQEKLLYLQPVRREISLKYPSADGAGWNPEYSGAARWDQVLLNKIIKNILRGGAVGSSLGS